MNINTLREITKFFFKKTSPNIWLECENSVPLHSQIRNEAYDTKSNALKMRSKQSIFDKNYIKHFVEKYKRHNEHSND